jgi:hypothetical protein
MFPSLGEGRSKQSISDSSSNFDEENNLLDNMGGGNWQSENTMLTSSYNSDFAPPRVTLRALFNHEPDEEGELAFSADSLITLIVSKAPCAYEIRLLAHSFAPFLLQSKDSPKWWRGSFNGQTGIFPSSYVEEVEITPTRKEVSAILNHF